MTKEEYQEMLNKLIDASMALSSRLADFTEAIREVNKTLVGIEHLIAPAMGEFNDELSEIHNRMIGHITGG